METKCYTEGKTVYACIRFYNGKIRRIVVRTCNTEEEAKAVANYYNIRHE